MKQDQATEALHANEKYWLKSYPNGVPADIDAQAYSSIVDVFQQSVEQFAESPSFSNMGAVITYGNLERKTREFAAFLQQELGLSKGDKIAIMMPNLLQYPIAIFGASRAGLTVTNINPLYTPRELKHQLVDSGATTIVILENFCQALAQIVDETALKTIITTRIGDLLSFPKSTLINFVVKHVKKMVPHYSFRVSNIDFKQALKNGSQLNFQPVDVNNNDIAFIQYTAGTTGVAKGVVLSHGNIVANLQQTSAWIGPYIKEGNELIITPLPLYHIFSLTANCLLYMKIGAQIHLITNPRDFKGFVNELSKIKFTAITGVNTLYKALLNTPGFSNLDFSCLNIALAGGMAVQNTVADQWRSVTGKPIIEAYGLTETSPGICINPIDLVDFNGNVGLPLPSTDCSIQDDKDTLLNIGEIGEICVRGPQVMSGYLNRPEQTEKVLKADGWLHTGDIGSMDEKGFVKILERKDDMILVSGFNVYPSEIENVLTEHPGVLEVAAIGVPDEKSGEVVKVFVVKQDQNLTEHALREFCKENFTGYKIPHHIEFTNTLPKSNVGKILRRELR